MGTHGSVKERLIDVGPTTSSWSPAGLTLDLERISWAVELKASKALNPGLRDHVLREAIPLGKTMPSIFALSWSASGTLRRR
jgi:hypothetical protein